MAFGIGKKTIEYVIYLLFWGVLLLAPYLGRVLSGTTASIEPGTIYAYWIYLLPAAIAFVLNNNILIPLLFYKKKGRYYMYYLICVVVLCCAVFLFSPILDYGHRRHLPPPERELFNGKRPDDMSVEKTPLHNKGMHGVPKHFIIPFYVGKQPTVHDRFFENEEYLVKRFSPKKHNDNFLVAISNPDTVRLLLVVFVLAFNTCVRLSFFTMRRDERLQQLEREKLKAELDYLKYQINPHFFMNTLNNIHALIDINADKAQGAVLELSKMMRYVLYDASSSFVSLEKDVSFLKSYIDLMRLRYSDKLTIKLDFDIPDSSPSCYVPSLLLVVFVENAFKHGVTYAKESDIEVSLSVDKSGWVLNFKCSNSCNGANVTKVGENGGIGVENARKRLELLYGNKASLNICNDNERYVVTLKIPLRNDKMHNS